MAVLASPAQYGMWITEQVNATGTAYNMPLAVWLDGPLDRPALLAACRAVLERHPVLGCAFEERDGELLLVPAEHEPPVTVAEIDIDAESARPFDVRHGPLARLTLAPLGPDRHLLLFVAHHLVFDGMSKDVLLHDLAALYAGTPLLPVSYEAAGPATVPPEAMEYWKPRWERLPGGTPLSSAEGGTLELKLTLDADRFGVTRFELLLAALHALLRRPDGGDSAVAVSLSTRDEHTTNQIGLLANELPVPAAPAPDMTFRDFAADVRAGLRELNRFRDVPLARAVGGIRPSAALTPVSISYRRRLPDPVFPGLGVRVDWMMSTGTVRNALHLQAVDGPDGLFVHLHHHPDVAAALIGERLQRILDADPDSKLADLPTAEVTVAARTEVRAASQADPELVEQIRLIWMEVLRIDDVAPDEDLYDLGGHSLTITQITARVRKRFGVEVPFDVFLDEPTVIGVAAAVGGLRA